MTKKSIRRSAENAVNKFTAELGGSKCGSTRAYISHPIYCLSDLAGEYWLEKDTFEQVCGGDASIQAASQGGGRRCTICYELGRSRANGPINTMSHADPESQWVYMADEPWVLSGFQWLTH